MDSATEQIKEKLSIEEVVGGYVKLQRAGNNFKARCPFHKERTPSFMVSPERGTYMCFGCGERGDIFSFVQKMDGVDFRTALETLAARAGVSLPRYASPGETAKRKEKEERLHLACEAATLFFEEELKKRKDVRDYLRVRGLSEETIRFWRLGYAPASWRDLSDHLREKGFSPQEMVDTGLSVRSEKDTTVIYDRFRGRIMFPIADTAGHTAGFSGRFFENVKGTKEEGEPAKYVNSPETELFKKSRILYGLDRAKGAIRRADCILLVEGQFDVVLAHQSGLPFTVALSGTALTEEHLSLLSRFSKRLVLALDADAAGLRSGLKSTLMAFEAGFDVKIPTFEGGKDPADLARENPELLRAAIRTSRTAIEFFLTALRPQAKDERAYKKLVEAEVLPLIARLQSRIDEEHFARIVANTLSVSEEAVKAEIAKHKGEPKEREEVAAEEPPQDISLLPLERSLLMLLFYFSDDESVEQEIAGMIGEERKKSLLEKHLPEAERFRFEFESLGGSREDTKRALFSSVRRALLEEEMAEVSGKLRAGSGSEERELLQRLSALKRREQELRN